jgi:hypothetical protein
VAQEGKSVSSAEDLRFDQLREKKKASSAAAIGACAKISSVRGVALHHQIRKKKLTAGEGHDFSASLMATHHHSQPFATTSQVFWAADNRS